MPRNNRGSRNNNPSGRNQYSNDWMDTVRERPMATAAAAAAAVGAGVFLWSKRNRIGDQISRLSDHVTGWADEMRSGSSSRELAMTAGPNESSAIEASRATGSRSTRSTGKTSRATSGQTMNAGRSGTATVTH
jgi:hypothetical protein